MSRARSTIPRAWPLLVAVASLLSCGGEGPTGPTPDPEPASPLLPESRPAVFAVGDTVTEAIDIPGDIDEFSFAAVQGTSIMLNVRLLTFPGQLVKVSVHDDLWNELFGFRGNATYPSLDAMGAPRWDVPATATYRVRVRVDPDVGPPTATASYQFELYLVNRAPEVTGAAMTLGVAMTGETTHRRGDIDEFTLPLTAGQWVNGNLVTQFTNGGLVTASLRGVDGSELRSWSHNAHSDQRDSTFATPLKVPATGMHRLVVTGHAVGAVPYKFRSFRTAEPYQLGVVHEGTVAANDSVDAQILFTSTARHRLSLRTTSVDPSDSLVAVVRDTVSGAILGEVRSGGGQAALHDAATWLLPAPANRVVRVTVRGTTPTVAAGFELMVRAPGAGPEHVPAAFAFGDTVTGEWFDGGADRDTWQFSAAAGDEVMVYVMLDTTSGTGGFVASVRQGDETVASRTFGMDADRLDFAPFLFTAPADGPYDFRVDGVGDWHGRYRFLMLKRDRAPESRGALIAFGDTVSDAVDEMADIDEYEFLAAAGDELVLNVSPAESFPQMLAVRLYDADWNQLEWLETSSAVSSLDEIGTGRIRLAQAGVHRIRVSAGWSDDRGDATGPYRFELYKVDRAPESTVGPYMVGATLDGERIERRGDIDEFEMPLDSGGIFVAILDAAFASVPGEIEVNLVGPDGSVQPIGGRSALVALNDSAIGARTQVSTTATYRLQFSGFVREAASYRFRTYPVDPGPEAISTVVTPGTWIEGETLDPLGDIDRFTFRSTAQKWYVAKLEAPAFPPASVSLVTGLPGSGWVLSDSLGISRIVEDESRDYTFVVEASALAGYLSPGGVKGPYRFRIDEVQRSPETTDSVIAVNDTIPTEGIEVFGDVDEFFITASDADTLLVEVHFAPGAPDRAFGVAIEDVETGAGPWGGFVVTSATFTLTPYATTPRPHRIRIMSLEPGSLASTGAYRLIVRRKP